MELHDVSPDGNCLFRALCDQLMLLDGARAPQHPELRAMVVMWVCA